MADDSNIDKYKKGEAVTFGKDAGAIAGTAGLAMLVGGVAMRRTEFSPALRGGILGGFEIVGALLTMNKYPRIAIGLCAAALPTIGSGLLSEVEVRKLQALVDKQGDKNVQLAGQPSQPASTTDAPASGLPGRNGQVIALNAPINRCMPVVR